MRRPLPILLSLCVLLGACTVKLGGDDAHADVGYSPIPNASLLVAGQYRLTRPCAAQVSTLRNRALAGLAGMTVQQDILETDTWVFAASAEPGTGITARFGCRPTTPASDDPAAEFLNVDYEYMAPGADARLGGLPEVFRTFLTEVAQQHDETAAAGEK